MRSMVITSDDDRHAARPGTVAGEDGALPGVDAAGVVAAGVVAAGAVTAGVVAAGADVGAAGCPVDAVGWPASAGWLTLGEAQATSTDEAATAAPASNAALGNVTDG